MYGFQAESEVDGSVLISSESDCILFLGKASFINKTLEHEPAGSKLYMYKYTLPLLTQDDYPTIFISMIEKNSIYIEKLVYETSNWVIYLLINININSEDQNPLPEIYCFGPSSYLSVPADDYGMAVYRSSGEIAYHSGWDNKILDIKVIDYLAAEDGFIPLDSSISKPAAMFTCNATRLYSPDKYLYTFVFLNGIYKNSDTNTYGFGLVLIDEYYDGSLTSKNRYYEYSTKHNVVLIDAADYD